MRKFMSLNEVREFEQATMFSCLLTRMDNELEIRAWAREIETYVVKNKPPMLMIDFHQVEFLNSSTIQFLIILRNRCQNMGIGFGLCRINGTPKKIFIKTRLFKLFEIGETPVGLYETLLEQTKYGVMA